MGTLTSGGSLLINPHSTPRPFKKRMESAKLCYRLWLLKNSLF